MARAGQAFHLTAGQQHDLVGVDALMGVLSQADAVIPSQARRKDPAPYDKELYKTRHLIENFFAKLKQYRAIATCYDKTARNFLAAVYLAAVVVWFI